MPARTSPDPETPRPALPLSSCQSRPSGAAIQDVDPPRPTTAWARPARSTADAGRVVRDLVLLHVQRVGDLGRVGREDHPAFRWCRQAVVGGDAGQAERVEGQRAGQVRQQPLAERLRLLLVRHARADEDGVRRSPRGRGPRRPRRRGSRRRRSPAAPAPVPRAEPRRRRPREEATVATCSLPAPARMAPSAASSTAPSVSVLPPMTRIEPRAFLPPDGSGSGQPRSTCGVTSVGSGAAGAASGSLVTSSASATRCSTSLKAASRRLPRRCARSGSARRWRPAPPCRRPGAPARSAPRARTGRP